MRKNRKLSVFTFLVLVLAMIACALPGTGAPVREEQTLRTSTPESVPADIGSEEPSPAKTVPPSMDQQVFLPNVESSGENELSGSYPAPEEVVDPYVSIEIDKTIVMVGETFSVTGKPIQIGLPNYSLIVRDEGVQDALPLAQITNDNQFTLGEGVSQVLDVIEARADMESATFTIQAIGVGNTTLEISVTGEVHTNQGALWSGAASGAVMIQVLPSQ